MKMDGKFFDEHARSIYSRHSVFKIEIRVLCKGVAKVMGRAMKTRVIAVMKQGEVIKQVIII